MEPPPARAATPALAGLAAGLAAGGWIGVADGLRAWLLGPSPFGGPDFAAGALVQAGAGGVLGLGGGWALGRIGGRGARESRVLVVHGLVLLYLALLAAGHLLPRQRATGSLGLNALLAAAATAAALVAVRASARRLLARSAAAAPPTAGGRLAVAVPIVLAAGAGLVPSPGGVDPSPPAVRIAEGARPPNVLVVLVDTLRADRVGASGSDRGLTPRIDAFARGATTFPRARTSSPWTKPSVTSLLTGLRPERHGMQDMEAVLPPAAPTLLSHLDRAGYRTALLSDSRWTADAFGFRRGVNGPFLHPESGFPRSVTAWRTAAFFRDWWVQAYHLEDPSWHRGAAGLSRRLLSWIGDGDPRPWAAYLHLLEPHHPYAPPVCVPGPRPRVPVQEFFGTVPYDRAPALPAAAHADLVANYDDEVREVDGAFGALLDGLRAKGAADGTILVFTADHGEEFHEHGGWTHEQSLQDELLRIPLVVAAPGGRGAGRVVADDVGPEDVLPTILELAGVATSARFDGRSLVPLLDGKSLAPRPSTGLLHRSREPVTLRSAALGNWKVIRCRKAGDDRELWFDLAAEPGETRPLPPPPPAVAEPLLQALRASEGLTALASGGEASLAPETRAALQALGYLGDAPAPPK